MSYLHCHTKGCGWSQDDFWNWEIKWNKLFKWKSRPFGYNPLSFILEDIAEYLKPKLVGFDINFICESKINTKGKSPEGFYLIHSWDLLVFELKRNIRRFIKMKYWTYKSFKRAKDSGKYKCPKCGSKTQWDID